MAPHDPAKQSLIRRFTPPVWAPGGNASYPLGTDQVGRDILSRMIHGARVSLIVSMIAFFVGGIIGTTLGLVSGYFGGRVEEHTLASSPLLDYETAEHSAQLSSLLKSLIG